MVRRCAALAALSTLALGLPARPQGGTAAMLAGPPGQEVEIEADRATWNWEAQVLKLEGNVVARRGEGVLRSAAGTLDRAHGVLTLSGGVLGVQGRNVFIADGAALDLGSRSADLQKATMFLKERPANPANPRAGRNSLVMSAQRVRDLGGGVFTA